ncbi:MAG: nucleotidyltransferase family protein [Mogibacterium sp.]|nr:nucleotidyltransferase family protein [Mogibacterium sp.]
MKITGITAEYNPLHNGHIYHMEESRRITGCDALVVAMSGDFVQRGEPAMLDKWTRAGLALENGADLVIEIPVLFCLGNASQYAGASVRLLEAAGCDHISFGSECGDAALVDQVAHVIKNYRSEMDAEIATLTRAGTSYPAARSTVYRSIRMRGTEKYSVDDELAILSSPNDILAVEYALAMRSAEPVVIRRTGAGYNEGMTHENEFQSASGIREMHRDGLDITPYVPVDTFDAILKSRAAEMSQWWDIIRYAVLSRSAKEIEDCPSGGDGLGNLLKKELLRAESADAFIKAVKSKKYTYTRISRLCMQVVLGITRRRYPHSGPMYIRVLGFNETGRRILAELREKEADHICPLPVITNINRESDKLGTSALSLLELDTHAADIYNVISGRDAAACSDHRMRPRMPERQNSAKPLP